MRPDTDVNADIKADINADINADIKVDTTAGIGAGIKHGLLAGAALLVLVFPQDAPQVEPGAAPRSRAMAPVRRQADFAGASASADARTVAQWVLNAADNGAGPFAIVDKKQAQVFVFRPDGRLLGATPVLLGYAAGDHTVPGIGERPIADVRPEERTTPAGRFVAEPGRNTGGEDIIWVDYDAAVSMHRVRPNNPRERRLERLASPTASDNRISYGCINMPVAFFDGVLWPAFSTQRGIVYVLPEVKTLAEAFPALAAAGGAAVAPQPVAVPARAPAPTPAGRGAGAA